MLLGMVADTRVVQLAIPLYPTAVTGYTSRTVGSVIFVLVVEHPIIVASPSLTEYVYESLPFV